MSTTLTSEKSEEALLLLDTDIESGIWALGITDKSIATDVVFTTGESERRFDFIHIRYRAPYGISDDGARIFKAAFQQTKPGGWIEVVETGVQSCPPSCRRPPTTAAWIRYQLLQAGFEDVEEKRVWKGSGSGSLQKIGQFLFSIFSMSWVWSGDAAISRKGSACRSGAVQQAPSVFVIARRPR